MDARISELANRKLLALETLHDETARMINAYKDTPMRGSQAMLELQVQKLALLPSGKVISQNDILGTTFNVAAVLFELGADHLMALQKVLKPPSVTLASWTCLRIIIESCSLACWLFDSTIDVQERMARGFACRYKNLEQQLRIANSTGDKIMVDKIGARLKLVEDEAVAFGYPVLQTPEGKRTGIGRQMPETVKLVQDIFSNDEVRVYRASSGVIHGNFSFIQSLGFHVIPPDEYKDTGAEEIVIEKVLTLETLSGLCRKAALVFIKPVWFKCNLYGWDRWRTSAIFGQVSDDLDIPTELRFWRSEVIKP